MKISSLIKEYLSLIRSDHHKDRDCHFYINHVYSYGDSPYYRIEHHGYINELPRDLFEKKFWSYEEAKYHLIDWLQKIIKEEKYRLENLGDNAHEQ
jgi:hypothetical protein